MKKFIIILIILLGIWLYKNPIGYISIVKPGLIIYSGVPILNMDILILPTGKFLIQSKSYKKIELSQNMIDATIDRLGGGKDRPEVVIIGQGLNKEMLLPIDEKLIEFFSSWNIPVYYGPTDEMAKKYNELKKQKKKIMALMSTAKPMEGIAY